VFRLSEVSRLSDVHRVKAAASAHLKSERSEHTFLAVTLSREGTMEQLRVREVMRPPRGDNITLAQARRVFRQIKREEEARTKAEQRGRRGEPGARKPEA
jgi:hypothetical protein